MTFRHVLLGALLGAFIHAPLASSAAEVKSADIAQHGLTQADFPLLRELVPGVYAYMDTLGPMHGVTITSVSLIVITDDGVVVVDGQDSVAQVETMVQAIRKLTPQPIRYVVIASDHGDHVNGNAAFKAAYPEVVFIASPVSQKRLANSATPPTETVADRRLLKVGSTEIELLNLGRAHTGGDLLAYLPQSKVLFMGEVYLRQVFPALTSAHPTEWTEVIRRAQAMDATWYVPGHGFLADAPTLKRDLQTALEELEYVIAEGKRLHAAGEPCPSRRDCPAVQKANWGILADLTLRDMQAPIALSKVYEEIEGRLPRD